ncbi:hypothetical protein PPS11_12886 [Pseudomonas putida S11]|nr:hypothetical protein PPS11_12886 [Pseudomonas putida S11]
MKEHFVVELSPDGFAEQRAPVSAGVEGNTKNRIYIKTNCAHCTNQPVAITFYRAAGHRECVRQAIPDGRRQAILHGGTMMSTCLQRIPVHSPDLQVQPAG